MPSRATMDPLAVIEECWAKIGRYADLPSLVAASRTCRALHERTVDAPTGKIKATFVAIADDAAIDAGGEGDASARNPHFAPRAINALHFPSLVGLKIVFPVNRTELDGDGEEVDEGPFSEAFAMLAVHVQYAGNLEVLEIDASGLIGPEEAGTLKHSFRILSYNLRRTRKLKRLAIASVAAFDNSVLTKFGGAFLAAMVPVVQECLLSLEYVSVHLGDRPSSSPGHDGVCAEFFEAVLRLQNLRSLGVRLQSFSQALLGDFLEAARSVQATLGRLPSEALECVEIAPMRNLGLAQEQELAIPSMAPFLSLLGGLGSLREFKLWLPQQFWDADSITAIGIIMNQARTLKDLSLHFDEYRDTSGQLVRQLSRFVEERESLPGPKVKLLSVGFVNEHSESFAALGGYAMRLEGGGRQLWQFSYPVPPSEIN